MSHGGYIDVPRRSATKEESAWVRDLVAANDKWGGVEFEPLFVTGACSCGCRSVVLEQPASPQMPSLVGHQGLVADMSVGIEYEGVEDVVSILLHHANGSLSLLDVIWYNFPDPVPLRWNEIGRDIRIDD